MLLWLTAVAMVLGCLSAAPGRALGAGETPYPVPYSGAGAGGVVLVKTRSQLCSGAVIQGSRAVVTAAHCLVSRGVVAREVSVVIDGRAYTPYSIGVRADYEQPAMWCGVLQKAQCTPTNGDFAVLWFRVALPRTGLLLSRCAGDPTCRPEQAPSGRTVLLGYQMTGANGVRVAPAASQEQALRPALTVIGDPENSGATQPLRAVLHGCSISAEHRIRYSNNALGVRCGLIQAGSGGVLVSSDGRVILGITSGVYGSNLWNLIVPGAHVRNAVWGDQRFFTWHAVANSSR
jgi:hypothetical protein